MEFIENINSEYDISQNEKKEKRKCSYFVHLIPVLADVKLYMILKYHTSLISHSKQELFWFYLHLLCTLNKTQAQNKSNVE